MNQLKVYHGGRLYGAIDHPDIIDEIERGYLVNRKNEIRFDGKGRNPKENEWTGFLDEYYHCIDRRIKCQ